LPAVEALAMEKKLSADLNTATNIAHGAGYIVVIKKGGELHGKPI